MSNRMRERGNVVCLEYERAKRDAEFQARQDISVASLLAECVVDGTIDPLLAREQMIAALMRHLPPQALSSIAAVC